MAEVTLRARLWDAFQGLAGDNAEKKATIARHLPERGRVLEVGCATGNVADVFAGGEYVGVDVDAEAIALAGRKHRQPGFRFYCLDVLADPLPVPGGFDAVLISHTAHHLPDDYLARLLHRSVELLRPGGTLLVLDMVRPEPHEPWNMQLFYRLDRGRYFRSVEEFRALFAAEPELEPAELHVIPMRKLGFEIVSDLVVRARKRAAGGAPA